MLRAVNSAKTVITTKSRTGQPTKISRYFNNPKGSPESQVVGSEAAAGTAVATRAIRVVRVIAAIRLIAYMMPS